MRKKETPEEQRLRTLARIYGEHPENEVAWRKLCEAAMEYAASQRAAPQPKNPLDGLGFDEMFAAIQRAEKERLRRKTEELRRAVNPKKWEHPF